MKNQKAFTLIELMIVVVILGTLASIALPKFSDMIKRAKQSATKGNLGAMRAAINIYYASNEYFPLVPLRGTLPGGGGHEGTDPYFSDMVVPGFIDKIPNCSLGMSYSEWDVLSNEEDGVRIHEGQNQVFACDNEAPSGAWSTINNVTWLWEEWVYNLDNGNIYVNAYGLTDVNGTPITRW